MHARYAGLHLTLEFPVAVADQQLVAALLTQNFKVQPLSRYVFAAPERSGLVLGIANSTEVQIQQAVQLIAQLWPKFCISN